MWNNHKQTQNNYKQMQNNNGEMQNNHYKIHLEMQNVFKETKITTKLYSLSQYVAQVRESFSFFGPWACPVLVRPWLAWISTEQHREQKALKRHETM